MDTKERRGKKAVAPKIDEAAAQFYSETFDTLNQGATWVMEAFPRLYRVCLSEMRGVFTAGELGMIIDVLNSLITLFSYAGASMSGNHIGLSISDTFELYPGVYERKWDVVPDVLNNKIASLSNFERTCIELWGASFWERDDYQEDDAIEKHCAALLPVETP